MSKQFQNFLQLSFIHCVSQRHQVKLVYVFINMTRSSYTQDFKHGQSWTYSYLYEQQLNFFQIGSQKENSQSITFSEVKNLPVMQGQRRCIFDPWVWKMPWRRKWQPTPIFLPGKFHGQKSLVGYIHGVTELDMTEHAHTEFLKVNPFNYINSKITSSPPQGQEDRL